MLLAFDDAGVAVELVARWRRQHEHALLVVDQFEELFTLNSPEVQTRFAAAAGPTAPRGRRPRPAVACGTTSCPSATPSRRLRPIFHEFTMLDPPTGANLRRALVQPATKCGYRFEDDELVEEMLAEVEGERGALPLLAFAMARLWEKRDRENGLLTRTGLSRHRRRRRRAGPARRGDDRSHRIRPRTDRSGAVPQPGHRRGHPGGAGVGRDLSVRVR